MRLKAGEECFTCSYCGTVAVPDANAEGIRVLGVPAALNCPVCAGALVHAAASGMRILYCDLCQGMLISIGIFPAIVQDLKAHRETSGYVARPFEPQDLDRHLRCPQCRGIMNTHLYGGGGNIIIDNCEKCDLNWLDHGELDRVVRAPDRLYV